MTVPKHRTVHRIGPFVKGERPDSFAPTFTDYAGNPLTDIDDWDAKAVYAKPDGTTGEQTAAITADIPIMGTWPDLDTAGAWYLEMWIGNGVLRYCSDLYVFDVGDPVGTTPNL